MKKKLKLKRLNAGNKGYTIGRLYLDDKYICDTLEDEVREKKVHGQTAIPKGTYKVTITYSPRFKKLMPLINDVPNFSGVRIHSGNTADDTEGCILVGENKVKGMVINSRAAYNRLMLMITQKDDITLNIE